MSHWVERRAGRGWRGRGGGLQGRTGRCGGGRRHHLGCCRSARPGGLRGHRWLQERQRAAQEWQRREEEDKRINWTVKTSESERQGGGVGNYRRPKEQRTAAKEEQRRWCRVKWEEGVREREGATARGEKKEQPASQSEQEERWQRDAGGGEDKTKRSICLCGLQQQQQQQVHHSEHRSAQCEQRSRLLGSMCTWLQKACSEFSSRLWSTSSVVFTTTST